MLRNLGISVGEGSGFLGQEMDQEANAGWRGRTIGGLQENINRRDETLPLGEEKEKRSKAKLEVKEVIVGRGRWVKHGAAGLRRKRRASARTGWKGSSSRLGS